MSDLDSILDAALDEFDAHQAEVAAPAAQTLVTAAPAAATPPPAAAPAVPSPTAPAAAASPPLTSDPESMAAFQAFLQAMAGGAGSDADLDKLLAQAQTGGEGGDAADFGAMLAQMAKLSTADAAAAAAADASSTASSAPAGAAAVPASSGSSAPADPISDAVRMIAEGARTMPPGAAAGAASAAGFDMSDSAMEAMMAKLMAEMGKDSAGGEGGGDLSDDAMERMVESMMGGMLSREHLYQPMKDISEKYPAYLAENAATISETDMANYRKQHDCFRRIVQAFDELPKPSMRVMELMNEMQTYGTPPKEIVDGCLPPGFDPKADMPPGMEALAGLAGGAGQGDMPPIDDALLQQLAKDDSCKTQ